jgi:hypothetical protein
LDLFTPVVPSHRFHPAFAKLHSEASEHEKQVFAEWSEGFVDRDGKFVKEFQTTFDSSFWEVYLHGVLKELGLTPDFRWERPDFCVTSPMPFVMEATVALHAQGTTPVTETQPLEIPRDLNEFNRQAIIRLSNSIHSKHRRFQESYSNLPHVAGKPFVVAITAFDRPHFYLQGQRAIEALLYRSYVDEETYLREHPNRDVPLKAQDLPFVAKDSGERLPLGLFCDSSMAGISAIIQSSSATWSKVGAMSEDPDLIVEAIYEDRVKGGQRVFRGPNRRYTESILDGLRVYHNPHATNPLDPFLFDRFEVFQATARGPCRMELVSSGNHILVNRRTIRFPAGLVDKAAADLPADQMLWHHIR